MGRNFVGRDQELAAINALLDGAAEGRGDCTAIVGAAGMGKSALFDAVGAGAERRGIRVVRVGAVEGEQHVPLGAAARLASAFGVEVDAGPDALEEVVVDLARGQPVACFLDDAQWIDTASVPFAVALVHAAMNDHVSFVVACRPPSPTSVALRRVLGSIERRGARLLHLGSLSDDDVRLLAEDVMGSPLSEDDRALLAAAAGNPFLVLEVADALRAGRRPEADSVLTHTLHHLSPGARALVEHASVLGRTAAVVDLAHMAGCSPALLLDDVKEATAAALVDPDREVLAFRHDLIRESIYGSLPTAVRGAIHRQAAKALEARDAPPLELAAHLVEGALPGDESAIGSLRAAATAASSADLGVATALLEAARRLCPAGSDMADDVDRRLVVFFGWTGRSDEAIALSDRLLERASDPDSEARLRAGLAEALARGGDEAAGAREAARALAVGELAPARRSRLLLLEAAGLWQTEPRRCRDLLAEGRANAEGRPLLDVAMVETEAMSYSAEGAMREFDEAATTGLARAREAMAARRPFAEAHLGWALSNAGEASIATERYDASLKAFTEAEHHFRRAGLTETAIPDLAGLRAEAHITWCRWDDAVAEIRAREVALLESGSDDSSASGVPVRVSALLARIAALRGDPSAPGLFDKWFPAVETSIERARFEWWAGLRAHFAGDEEAAVAHFEVGTALVRQMGQRGHCAMHGIGWQFSWATPFVVLWRARRRDDAATIADVGLPASRRNDWLPRWASAAACAAAVIGRDDALARRALDHAREVAAPLFRWFALRDVAAADVARDVAHTAAAEAEALATDFDLAPSVSAEPVKPPPARPVTGWDSLTPSEARVAELVADGLSNVAIADELLISRYTVETHLKHVFQKLNIRSRVELATIVVRRGTT